MPMIELDCPALQLRTAVPTDAEAITEYLLRNRAFHARYEPLRPESHFSVGHRREQILAEEQARARDGDVRFWLFGPNPPGCIGQVALTKIARGPFQAAYLGFGIDQQQQGRGVMRAAAAAVIAHAFGGLRLRRLMANHLPDNERSARLLARLGFRVEGYAREYLCINGAWRDHVLTSLINPDWRGDEMAA